MHVWFRFCAVIALMASLQSAMAQSTPATTLAAAEEIPVSKHRLKPSTIDVVQQQGKRIEQLSTQIEAQTKQIEQLSTQIEAQTKQTEELTKRAELQTKQIETLNGDLNRLTTVLLARNSEAATPSSPAGHPQSAPSPATTPVVQPPSETPAPVVHVGEPVPAAPDASTADGATHVVKRGENLISIARQHGITVSELLKFNKIEDERKLQIGQTLLLPKPTPPKPDSQ